MTPGLHGEQHCFFEWRFRGNFADFTGQGFSKIFLCFRLHNPYLSITFPRPWASCPSLLSSFPVNHMCYKRRSTSSAFDHIISCTLQRPRPTRSPVLFHLYVITPFPSISTTFHRSPRSQPRFLSFYCTIWTPMHVVHASASPRPVQVIRF
jgi:hypothetical protein